MKQHDVAQKTDEWRQLRKGKITGKFLSRIMGGQKAREEAEYDMLAQRLTVGLPDEYENPMERGTRLEPEAIALFELETGKKVRTVGFCEDDDEAAIANSPDGLIGETEAVEAKCPEGKNYVKAWQTNEIPSEYKWQTVQYFVVNAKLEILYFILYNPDISVHPLHIMELKRADIATEIAKARKEQEEFIAKVNAKLDSIIKPL